MRNQGRNRRSRGKQDVNDEDGFNAREEPHAAKTYHRNRHIAHHDELERIAAASTSGRIPYDIGRDRNVESSRNIRDDGWGHGAVGNERFDYGTYHHAEHDIYDTPMRRDAEGWRGNGEAQHSTRADWNAASYHQSEPSTSHPESSTWTTATTHNTYPGMTPPSHVPRSRGSPSYRTTDYYEDPRPDSYYDAPRGYYPDDQWGQSREVREPLPEDSMSYNTAEKPRNQGWRKESRREKGGGQQKFQSDSGWSTRKKGKEWSGESSHSRWAEDSTGDKHDATSTEDRAWVPAEAWKSGNRTSESSSSKQQQSQHREGGRQSQRSSKQQKSSRKSQQSSKQKKSDWREEEAANLNLNNWTRRDVSTSSKKSSDRQPTSSSRRKHPRSLSRSRSRSLESHRSVRSAYAQSRSRSSSPVPKRRRRDPSPDPPPRRSHSPRERDTMGWVPPPREEGRYRSPSPPIWTPASERVTRRSPSPVPTRPTRRSPTYSDMSSERSRSRSPGGGHRRAVHRLPAAPPAHVPTAGPTKSEKKSRKSKKKKNGHDQSHRVDDKRQRYTDPEPKLAEIALPMHPPPAPQTFSHDRVAEPLLVERSSKMVYPPPQATLQPELPTRIVPPRTIGFKPIGKTNSALKRFFPGDDDDGEQAEVAEHRDPPSAPPASTAHFPQAAYGHGANGHYGQNGFGAPYQVPPHGRGKWPAIPHNVALAMENGYRQHYTQLPGLPPPPHPTEATQLWNQPIPNWLPDSVPPRPIPAQPTWSQPPIAPTVPLAPEQAQQPPPYSPVQQSPTYTPYVSPSNMAPASFNVSPNQEPQAGRDVGLPPHFSESETRRAAPEPESKKTVTSSKELYAILNQVGEGTFGKVYKAQNTASKLYVALKRIRMETERDGFPVTAMREIKLLQSLKHQNVVRLHEMMVSNGSVFMVFEYMDHDLTGILSQNQFKFSDAHLKSLCHQMLAGLAYLHHKGVIHRDIKGSNILLNNRGELKLADFGLARFYQKRRRSDYTNRVITLWYRPPELLFGATIYGAEVDMWSAGCIMLELFTKKPVFQGNDEINQLQVIFKILGTPTPDRWLGLLNLPWYELVKPREALPNRFRDLFSKWMSPAALDLAERLLTYDPSQRVSAQDAMDAPYFTQEGPSAEPPTGLSTLGGEWHELETKVERQKKRKKESAA